MEQSYARPPFRPDVVADPVDPVCLQPRRVIKILHPGYGGVTSVLLELDAYDGPEGGLHLATVLGACFIISGNRTDGHLSRGVNFSAPAVGLAYHDLLPCGSYYFHVPAPSQPGPGNLDATTLSRYGGQSYCWPVVPTFRDWQPPAVLPLHWNAPIEWPRDVQVSQDHTLCRVTCRAIPTEEAHVIPESEAVWARCHDLNGLARQGRGIPTDNSPKHMRLAMEVRWLYDHKYLTFVPKPIERNRTALVAHVLEASHAEVVRLYHNRHVHVASWIPIEYHFVRFAWSIFPQLSDFFGHRTRELMVWNQDQARYGLAETFTADKQTRFMANQDNSRDTSKFACSTKRRFSEADLIDDTTEMKKVSQTQGEMVNSEVESNSGARDIDDGRDSATCDFEASRTFGPPVQSTAMEYGGNMD